MASATRLPGGQLVQPGRRDRARHVDHEELGRRRRASSPATATVVLANGSAASGGSGGGRSSQQPDRPRRPAPRRRHRPRCAPGVDPVASASCSSRSRHVRGGSGRSRAGRRRRPTTSDRRCRARSLPGRDEAASRGKDRPDRSDGAVRPEPADLLRSPRASHSASISSGMRRYAAQCGYRRSPPAQVRAEVAHAEARRRRAGATAARARARGGAAAASRPPARARTRTGPSVMASAPGRRPPRRSRAPRPSRRSIRTRSASEQPRGEPLAVGRGARDRRGPAPRAGRRSAGGRRRRPSPAAAGRRARR